MYPPVSKPATLNNSQASSIVYMIEIWYYPLTGGTFTRVEKGVKLIYKKVNYNNR